MEEAIESWEFTDHAVSREPVFYRFEKRGTLLTIRSSDPEFAGRLAKYSGPKVLSFLEFLLRANGKVLTRDEIQEEFWKRAQNARTLDTYLTTLRKLLNDDSRPNRRGSILNGRIIETLSGGGLRFAPRVTCTTGPQASLASPSASDVPPLQIALATAFTRRKLEQSEGCLERSTRITLDSTPPPILKPDDHLALLRAHSRAIPLVGRERDFANLRDWLRSNEPVSVRVLTGPPGAGKTRLAWHLLDSLVHSEWHVGFLRRIDPSELAVGQWDVPTLAVVDYPEPDVEALKAWLRSFAQKPSTPPFRILILAREANPEFGWLRQLLDHTSEGRAIAALLNPAIPERITPISDCELRRQIISSTLNRICPTAELPAPGTDAFFERLISEPRWQDPLNLMMAALVAGRPGGLAHALSMNRTDLAFELADRELDRLAKFLPPGSHKAQGLLLTRLAGIVTASGSMEIPELVLVAREEANILGLAFPGGPRAAVECLTEALGRDGRPCPIEPDIVGEATLLRVFGGRNLDEGKSALVRSAARDDLKRAKSVCFALIRTAQDFVSEKIDEPLKWIEEFVASETSNDSGLLIALERALPRETLMLREQGARIDRLLFEKFKQAVEVEQSPYNIRSYTQFSSNYSLRLGLIGQLDEAIGICREAVRIEREIYSQVPALGSEGVARGLLALKLLLQQKGENQQESLECGEEAIEILRDLLAEGRDDLLEVLALALNNHGVGLTEALRHEEGLTNIEEALGIYRSLIAKGERGVEPELARSLTNAAAILMSLDRVVESLTASENAFRIYQVLAQQVPDSYEYLRVLALSHIGSALIKLNRVTEAITAIQSAVSYYQTLPQPLYNQFRHELARCLHLLGYLDFIDRRSASGLDNWKAAAEIYRGLWAQYPSRFGPDLATALLNCGVAIAQDSQELGLPWLEGAATVLLPIFRKQPVPYSESMNYITSIYNAVAMKVGKSPERTIVVSVAAISATLKPADYSENSLALYTEALPLLIPVFAEQPQEHVPLMKILLGRYTQAAEAVTVDVDPQLYGSLVAILASQSADPTHVHMKLDW